MGKNKPLEDALKKLQELDERINDGGDDEEILLELNDVINGITKELKFDVIKNNIPDLKYINLSNNPDLEFAEEGDSGFDLRAFIPNDVVVPSFRVRTIPTGIYVEVEKGLEVQARSRSGLADKFNLFVLNSPGTVDSRYRGEIKIILANFGEEPFTVHNGDRIAQGVVCHVCGEGFLNLKKVDKLSESKRNTRGLGSTGIQ